MKKTIILIIITFLSTGLTKAQEKITLDVKDLNSSIEKYIKKIYPEFKTMEAFKHDLVYGIRIQKGDTTVGLIFDRNGKFKSKITPADKEKYALQTRASMSLDDVSGDITKYVKKNHEGYKVSEAYRYDEVYVVKIMKAEETENLLFDKDGKFVKKLGPAKSATTAAPAHAAPAVKKDSVPPVQEKTEEPTKTDTIKKP